jgi:AcrR family transcriptional regulator
LTKRAAAVPDDDKILDAAARLFRLKGFEGATLRAIAKAAGLLPGSLHYRYPTKDALLLALMKRGVERDL